MSIDFNGYTAMQQYYMKQRLPGFADKRNEETPAFKKDSQFYRDTINTWNNPARAGPKTISYYHNQVQEGEKKIELRRKEEQLMKEFAEEGRRSFHLSQKFSDSDLLQTRIAERLVLQAQSKQDIITSDSQAPSALSKITNSEFVSKASVQKNRAPLLGRAPHSWNKLNLTSQKYIDMAVTPAIIKGDEQAMNMISDRIAKDEEIEALKQKSYESFRVNTRSAFLKSHQKNMEFQAKCGLLPPQKPLVITQSRIPTAEVISRKSLKLANNQEPHLFFATSSGKNNSLLPTFNSLAQSTSNQSMKRNSQTRATPKNNNNSNNINIESTHDTDDNQIVIQYTNKAHEQSKHEVNQINFGDEVINPSYFPKNGAKVSTAVLSSLSMSTITKEPQSTQAGMKDSLLSSQQKFTPIIRTYDIQNGNTDRDYLTSAESHSKKQVNFNAKSSTGNMLKDEPIESYGVFELRNLQDFQLTKDKSKGELLHSQQQQRSGSVSSRSRIDRLAQPFPKQMQPKDVFDRTEYKGLLLTELGANADSNQHDTNFTKTIKLHSEIANSHISHSIRPSTRQSQASSQLTQMNERTFTFSRPSTTMSAQRSRIFKNALESTGNASMKTLHSDASTIGLSQKDAHIQKEQEHSKLQLKSDTFKELDMFEKEYNLEKGNRVGFSQINLKSFQQKEVFMSAKSALTSK